MPGGNVNRYAVPVVTWTSRPDLGPHDVHVPLGGQQSECEWLDDKPACIAGRSQTLTYRQRKHGAFHRWPVD